MMLIQKMVILCLVTMPLVHARTKLAYPGLPPQLVTWLLDQEVYSADGSTYTVLSWLEYFAGFDTQEWASWCAENHSVDNVFYSAEEWEAHWEAENQQHPEREYMMNWALPLLGLHNLTQLYRSIVRAVMAQRRREREVATNRLSPY